MSVLLYIASFVFFCLTSLFFVGARNPVYEIFTGVLLLNATLCLVGGAITSAIGRVRRTIETADKNNWAVNRAICMELKEPEKNHPLPGIAPNFRPPESH